jgi:hypothetical protein
MMIVSVRPTPSPTGVSLPSNRILVTLLGTSNCGILVGIAVAGVAVSKRSGVSSTGKNGLLCGTLVGVDVGVAVSVGVNVGVGVSVGVLLGPGEGVSVIVGVSVGAAAVSVGPNVAVAVAVAAPAAIASPLLLLPPVPPSRSLVHAPAPSKRNTSTM